MARATSSLPVPLSPVMSTQASRGATRAMRLNTACIAGLRPTNSSGAGGVALGRRGRLGGRPSLQRALDGLQRLAQVERLCEIVEGAVLHGPHGRGQVAEGGDDDDRGVVGQFAQPAQGRQPVHAGQAHVEDDRVGPLLGGEDEGLLGGGGRGNGMALGGQGALQRPADRFLIVHDQDVFHNVFPGGLDRVPVSG